MAKEIKQKIVLEGERDYSAALKDAQRNLRTLRSELKAETAELGTNATQQQRTETRTRNLKKQIAEQEKVVRTYRAALQEVREKYADNEDAIASWEQKLNNARATLGNMRNELSGVGDELKSMQTDAGTAVIATKSVADAIGQIASVGSSVSSKIESIFSGMVETIKNVLSEVWGLISETAAKANNWSDIAGYWNTDAQTIQQWARAVQASANSFGDLESSMTKIVMGDHDKIAQMTGVSWLGDKDQWRYAMDVMNSLASMSYEQKLGALEEIFGERRATKIMDLLNDWQTIQDLVPQFNGNETGYGMNDQELQTMNDLWTRINTIEEKWDALKENIAGGLGRIIMPLTVNVEGALDGVADYLAADNEADRQKALDKIRTNLEEFFRKLGEIVQECLKILSEVGHELQNSDDPVTKAIGDILVGLTDALQWMIDNQEAVKAAFETIFGVWLLGKLTAVAGQLLKITTYLKTIKGYNLLQNLPGVNGNGGGNPTVTTGGGNGSPTTTDGGGGSNPTVLPATKPGTPTVPKKIAPTKLPSGWVADLAGGLLTEAAVTAVALAPAIAATVDSQNKAMDEKIAAENANQYLRAVQGVDENTALLEKAVDALGPQRDENGNFKRDATGLFINTASAGTSLDVLMGLRDRKNIQMAQLQSDLQTYGRSNALGWDPWLMLQRVWDPRHGLEDWEESWSFSQAELDELLDVVRDAIYKKAFTPERTPTPTPDTGIIDHSTDERAALMGLRERSDQQLNELHNALMGQEGGEDAWAQLLNLWENDNLTTTQVQRLYEVLTEADASILETAARRAAEEAAQAAEEARIQAELDKLLGLSWRQNQERSDMMGQLYGVAGGDTVDDLLALWGGQIFSPEKIDELYNTVFGTLEQGFNYAGRSLMPGWGYLSADAWQGVGSRVTGGGSQQEGVSSQDLQGFRGLPGQVAQSAREGVAAGISGIKVYMDGTVVGHLVAPVVSREIARQVF